MKKIVFTLVLAAIVSGKVYALDYFGDIDKNSLVLKLTLKEGTDMRRAAVYASMFEFPIYLILENGVPVVSQSETISEQQLKSVRRMQPVLNIVNLTEFDSKTNRPIPGGQQYVEFVFSKSGWSSDQYVHTYQIPFLISDGEKQMLEFSSVGSARVTWNDPLNKSVNVRSYWSGMNSEVEFKVEVIESTLGFNNKIE
jgi:hypothetical protein